MAEQVSDVVDTAATVTNAVGLAIVDGTKIYFAISPYMDYIRTGAYIAIFGISTATLYSFLSKKIRKWTWKPNRNLLSGKVALVTGGSRGVGKGIALGLAEAGATVIITGRTVEPRQGVPGSLTETAIQCNGLGGKGVAVECDHSRDEDIQALFDLIMRDYGKLDILVNNVFESPSMDMAANIEKTYFWEGMQKLWDPVMSVGLRSHYVASCYAAKMMTKQKEGVIINISSMGAKEYAFYVAYGVGKSALDRMTKDMSIELKDYNVSALSVWPGLVKTEHNMQYSDFIREKYHVDVDKKGESPIYTGRVIAALASDPKIYKLSGNSITNETAAKKYGVIDIDGRQPAAFGTWSFYMDHGFSLFKRSMFGSK